MTDQNREIIDLCRKLGIDQHGLGSIRNFIAAAFYHVRLPGTLPADKHVAYNTAIRRATNRIACQGRHGDSRSMSRLLSRRALDLRKSILHDDTIPPGKKLGEWRVQVTEEHQEPALAVEKWIEKNGDMITVDDVVHRLLISPCVITICKEEKAIPNEYRRTGFPEERYRQAGIEPVLVEHATALFFENHLRPKRVSRTGRYHVEPSPFES